MRAWPPAVIGGATALAIFVGAMVGGVAGSSSASWAVGVAAGAATSLGIFGVATGRYRRRRRIVRGPFPEAWRAIVAGRMPWVAGLPEGLRRRFEDDVRIFLAEQRIVGAKGVIVDEATRVLIAASAARMTLGMPGFEWPTIRDIVVHPRSFDREYKASEEATIAGMVHAQGPILLSLRDLRQGLRRPADGHDVVLHELAHVIDLADGQADGVPAGAEWVASAPWGKVVADRLRKVRARRYRHVLRDYAGTDEAELFAVAVEVFFEQPGRLRARDGELYAMLVDYFGQDPEALMAGAAGALRGRAQGLPRGRRESRGGSRGERGSGSDERESGGDGG